MADRKLVKKWIVDKVVVEDHAVVVPLCIDPETGIFWFDYKGQQYEDRDRDRLRKTIPLVVRAEANLPWEQLIAVEPVAPWRASQGPLPVVGFKQLMRFERAVYTIEAPPTWRRHSGNEKHRVEAYEKRDKFWEPVKRVQFRAFPGDEIPKYNGDSYRSTTTWTPNREATVLPYTEELWARLCAIHDACIVMHERLVTLLAGNTDEVIERLLALPMAGNLLTDRGSEE